jgi:hypothetical protein
MARGVRRKCRCCRKLFQPSPRSRGRQHYCSAPRCKAASKTASHARWRGKPQNQDYWRDPCHVARVQDWRARNPGYARKGQNRPTALQDVLTAQRIDPAIKTARFVRAPLQEIISAQPAVLIGLIAHLVGTPLQDDIARAADRLLRLGRDILALSQDPPA